MSYSEPRTSYEPDLFRVLYANEDEHFWFRVRNTVIANVINQIEPHLPEGYRVLEIGCGTGNVLRHLDMVIARGTVYGMDLFMEGLRYAALRTELPLIQADIHASPFTTQFDVICLFDVLEHLDNDMRVLTDIFDSLVPGGYALFTVPAHPWLWSYFDEASHHCRRYTPDELAKKLSEAGYGIEYSTQYMMSILPVVWLRRRLAVILERFGIGKQRGAEKKAVEELTVSPIINNILYFLLSKEADLILPYTTIPIGTSLLFVARKPL